MEDEEILKTPEFEDDLGDIELTSANYQVWLLGYDEDDNITDYELLVKEFSDPQRAVEFAKNYDIGSIEAPDAVAYVELLVETVVADEDDSEMNVGTLYSEYISLKEN